MALGNLYSELVYNEKMKYGLNTRLKSLILKIGKKLRSIFTSRSDRPKLPLEFEKKLRACESNFKLLEASHRLRMREWATYDIGDVLRENELLTKYELGRNLLFVVEEVYPSIKIIVGPFQTISQVHGILKCIHERKITEFEADFRSFELVAKAKDVPNFMRIRNSGENTIYSMN